MQMTIPYILAPSLPQNFLQHTETKLKGHIFTSLSAVASMISRKIGMRTNYYLLHKDNVCYLGKEGVVNGIWILGDWSC